MQNKQLISLKWIQRREKQIQPKDLNFISKFQKENKKKIKKTNLLSKIKKILKKKNQRSKKFQSRKKLFLKFHKIQIYKYLHEAFIFTYIYFLRKC